MLRTSCALALTSILAASAAGQGFGYIPAARTHNDQYLRQPFRVPLEALFKAASPAELASLSVSPTPRFASAPVVSIESNPFGNAAGSLAATPDGESALDGYTAEPVDSPAVSDPFGDSPAPAADPFSAGADDADPFGGPDPGADDADPFADSGEDPFGF